MTAPTGIYASSGALSNVVTSNSAARGALIRVKWSEIEPGKDQFDFTALDNQINAVKTAGKLYSLGVLAGPFAPIWLTNGTQIKTIQGPFGPIPVWWNAYVIDRLSLLATALGNKYNSDASLKLVYIPQMSGNGIEGHFNGVPNLSLTNSGYSTDDFVSAAQVTSSAFLNAFPDKSLALEYHTINNSSVHASQLMAYTLGTRIGAACWWINGAMNYQPELMDIFRTYQGDKYAQILAKSSSGVLFPNGYLSVFDQAKELSIRYIEPWDFEFTLNGNPWASTFNDFNSWSDQTFIAKG